MTSNEADELADRIRVLTAMPTRPHGVGWTTATNRRVDSRSKCLWNLLAIGVMETDELRWKGYTIIAKGPRSMEFMRAWRHGKRSGLDIIGPNAHQLLEDLRTEMVLEDLAKVTK
jgi:hypothetical protein